jgi:hypothetical protein
MESSVAFGAANSVARHYNFARFGAVLLTREVEIRLLIAQTAGS